MRLIGAVLCIRCFTRRRGDRREQQVSVFFSAFSAPPREPISLRPPILGRSTRPAMLASVSTRGDLLEREGGDEAVRPGGISWGHIWKLNFRIRAYLVKLSFQM